MVKSLKKYRLIKSSGKDFPGPCAFFMTEKGCRSGSLCKFFHNDDLKVKPRPLSSPNNSTPIKSSSSESECSGVDILSPPSSINLSKRKVIPSMTSSYQGVYVHMDNISSNSGSSYYQDPSQHQFLKRSLSKNLGKSKRPNESHIIENLTHRNISSKKSLDNKIDIVLKDKTKKQKPNNSANFTILKLPVASFHMENIKANSSCGTNSEKHITFPRSSAEGLKWKEACIATHSHERYDHLYNFEYHQQKDAEYFGNTDWIHARPYGKWCENYPQAIALDCEMCETNDPNTGFKDGKALCRISIINASNPEEILLDSLVKPQWPIVDDRFRIHGIQGSTLKNLQFTLKHAQKFLKALCSEETVIIGHAVHNDLVALKFIHHCIVDSSLLFNIRDEPHSACSLKDLSMAILGKKMPEIHDSVQDSRVSLLCLQVGYIGTNGNPQYITRSIQIKRTIHTEQKKKLLVHRIPTSCKVSHIKNMFLSHTSIQPVDVKDIEYKNCKTGRTTVVFLTDNHANLAFTTLLGGIMTDASGKYQKRVYLNGGEYLQVRKMLKE